MDNPAFQKKVAECAGGTELLLALGFLPDEADGVDYWAMPADANIPSLKALVAEVGETLKTIDYKPPAKEPKAAAAKAVPGPPAGAGGQNPLMANLNSRSIYCGGLVVLPPAPPQGGFVRFRLPYTAKDCDCSPRVVRGKSFLRSVRHHVQWQRKSMIVSFLSQELSLRRSEDSCQGHNRNDQRERVPWDERSESEW